MINKFYILLHIFNNRQRHKAKDNLPSRRSHVLYNSNPSDHQIMSPFVLMAVSYLSTLPCNVGMNPLSYHPYHSPDFGLQLRLPFLRIQKSDQTLHHNLPYSQHPLQKQMKSLNKINIAKLYIDNVSILIIHVVILFKIVNIFICLFQNFYTRSLSKKLTGFSTIQILF